MKKYEVTTVCCVCGAHLKGPWPAPREDLSHGLCDFHFKQAMRNIEEYIHQRKEADEITSLAA